jgi:hypothetical protein
VSIFARLIGRAAPPEDPLLARLTDLPVPQSAAGTFVERLERDEQRSTLVKAQGDDRKRGVIAQYALQWNQSMVVINAQIAAGDTRPLLQWVRQLLVLLTDAEAATRWFAAKAAGLKGYEGREVGGFRYGQITLASLPSIGNEANLMLAPNTERGNPFHDTYVNFRSGRLVGSVSASAIFGDPGIDAQLEALAAALARRTEEALRRGN